LAHDKLRATFVSWLGRGLREVKPAASADEWVRVKSFLNNRFYTIIEEVNAKEKQPQKHLEELSAYVEWVPFIPEDLEEFYPMIKLSALASEEFKVNQFIEFLSPIANEHAYFSISILEDLLNQEHRSLWFLRAGHDVVHVRNIIEAAKESGDDEAKDCAIRVINLFGERGDERYRDLLV